MDNTQRSKQYMKYGPIFNKNLLVIHTLLSKTNLTYTNPMMSSKMNIYFSSSNMINTTKLTDQIKRKRHKIPLKFFPLKKRIDILVYMIG